MAKQKIHKWLMARDFDRQIAEPDVRIAVLDGYTAPGKPISEAVG